MSIWLDGMGLEDISPRVKIKTIEPGVPAMTLKTADNAKYGGVRFLMQKEGARTVKIVFRVLEANAERRENILADINAWARGKHMELADRPGLYLPVLCTAFPTMKNQRDYSADITMTFTAFNPAWRATVPETVTVKTEAGKSAFAYLQPSGTEDATFLEFEIKNTSTGIMNTATVTVNGRSFAFAGLGLVAGGTVAASYDDAGLLSIATLGGMTKLHCRTAQSNDDLLLYQRQPNKVTVITAVAADVKLIGRGRYR